MNLLFLTILFPFLGFVLLASSQGKWSENISTIIGVGSVAVSAFITAYIVFDFYHNSYSGGYNYVNFVFTQELWRWFYIDNLNISVILRLDGLSIIMLSVIIGIGFIIHIYASWYMSGSEGYSRFFAYTNLFISNMLILVLSDNLLLMYFGWEGVGLCSYLLIGFYYFQSKNSTAALKSFIMTRVGDVCLVCALFMIYDQYHTLSINELLKLESQSLLCPVNNNNIWISSMLLVGAIGKSAQLPLHTWLISAMVGPTPVSALIHAATMVTSGVYLISRVNNFLLITPYILYVIGIIGSLTLIISSCSALFQDDIKKILAYSTISQIGYMFIALGEGHWGAAIFHLTTHAFFKALLFLAAGSLIYACQYEQNIFKMGGLYKFLPLIYICFMIGGASLSALPIITAGFYSKETILLNTLANHDYFFLFSGLIGMFLTSIYTFRMIFIIFHGPKKINPRIHNKINQNFPLGVLLLLSTFIGGWIKLPLSDIVIYHNDIYKYNMVYFGIISGIIVISGMLIASIIWLNYSFLIIRKSITYHPIVVTVKQYFILSCYYGWGFDWLYKIMFIRPYLYVINKLSYYDPIDKLINTFVLFLNWLEYVLICGVNGKISWYITSVNVGAIVILTVILFCI